MAVRMLEVSVNTICAGQLCTNVTHWSGDSAETNLWLLAKDVLQALTDNDNTTVSAESWKLLISSDAFVSSLTVRVLEPTPGTKAIKVFQTTDYVGDLQPDIYAQSVAGVIKLVTASGPDLTGRIFMPAVPEAAILNGRFTNDYRDQANLFIATLQAGIDATVTWDQVVYKRSTHTYEPVTNWQLNPNPGTIRKRLLPV